MPKLGTGSGCEGFSGLMAIDYSLLVVEIHPTIFFFDFVRFSKFQILPFNLTIGNGKVVRRKEEKKSLLYSSAQN